MSTPRSLRLPTGARRVTLNTSRGAFAALEAAPASGACERQPALLVPGYTGSKEDFLAVLGPLATAGRRVLAVDMRGQYQSPPAPGPGGYRLAALAADVAAVAAELSMPAGPGRAGHGFHLLGHSFGGLVVRELALAGIAPVASLTFLSSGPGRITGPRAAELSAVLALLRPLSPAGLPAEVRRLWDTQLGPAAAADGVPPAIAGFLRTRMLASCPLGLREMAGILLRCPDKTAALAALRPAPMLVIYGENDDAWAPAQQEDMAQRLRAGRVCIPGAAHSPAVEAPETLAAALTAFWNAAEGARAAEGEARPPLRPW